MLVAALIPFLAVAVDLFAHCRRRRIPLGPAVRSYLSRLGFWLFVGLAFAVIAKAGGWPQGDPLPIPPQSAAAHAWPIGALVVLAVVSAVGLDRRAGPADPQDGRSRSRRSSRATRPRS